LKWLDKGGLTNAVTKLNSLVKKEEDEEEEIES